MSLRPAPLAFAFVLASLTGATSARADQSFDEEGVNLVVARASRQAQDNCAKVRNAEGRMAGPWGTAKVTLVLNHSSGRVRDVLVDDAFDDTPTGRCVEGAYKLLIVAPWSGKDAVLERDITLTKPPEADEEERAAQQKKAPTKGKKK